jgi:hypothetical protein
MQDQWAGLQFVPPCMKHAIGDFGEFSGNPTRSKITSIDRIVAITAIHVGRFDGGLSGI